MSGLWAAALLGVVAVGGASSVRAGDAPVKVYLLAGQSNMVGPGRVTYVEEKHPQLMKPREDVWCINAGKVSGPLKPGYGYGEQSFGLELTMGYSFIYWSDVARAGDQIDFAINPTQITGTLTGPARPEFLFDTTGFMAQGLHFGLEYNF